MGIVQGHPPLQHRVGRITHINDRKPATAIGHDDTVVGASHGLGVAGRIDLGDQGGVHTIEDIKDRHAGSPVGHGHDPGVKDTNIHGRAWRVSRGNNASARRLAVQRVGAVLDFGAVGDAVVVSVTIINQGTKNKFSIIRQLI